MGSRTAASTNHQDSRSVENSQSTGLVARVVVAVAAAVQLVNIVALLQASRTWLVQALPDDAYYYLEIANHAARGEGPTIDGLHKTNGFHPLWLAIESALALFFHDWALVKAALICEVILFTIGTFFVYVVLRRVMSQLGAAVAALAANVCLFPSNGMESAVVVFALGFLLLALERADTARSSASFFGLGACTALLVFARLDFIVPVVVIGAPALAMRWRNVRALAITSAGALCCLVPFATWAQIEFGSFVPVSGYIKEHAINSWINTHYGGRDSLAYAHFLFDQLGAYGRSVFRLPTSLILAVPLYVAAIAGLVFTVRAQHERKQPTNPAAFALVVLTAVIALKAVMDEWLSPFWALGWYSMPVRVAAVVLVVAFAQAACGRFALHAVRYMPPALILATLVSFGYPDLHHVKANPSNWQEANYAAGQWISQHGPSGVYGSPDSGLLSFTADKQRAVVNLDGLTNNYSYARLVLGNGPPLQRYQSQHVEYFVARRDPGDTDAVPSCAVSIWKSPDVVYGGGLDAPAVSRLPVQVFSLQACH